MGNRKISLDIKECALRLWELGWDRSTICSTLLVSQASLYHWAKIFDEFSSVTPPPPPIKRRPRIIGLAALTAVKELYTHHPDTYIEELRWWLTIHHDIPISAAALHETLERTGLTYKLLHKIAVARDIERRWDFLYTLQNKFSGTGHFEDPFVRGIRYTLVAAIGMDGYIAQRVVEGSLDSFGLFDFVVEDVVPQMGVFPDNRSVLVMDNCRIHHTDTLQEVLNAQGMPDFSESSFGYI
ncbi:hypothetical protein C8R45DRAFT_846811 [Mycena sanguinolenta]|nr:hypothetical protein C8R45DRAFT_846811 [Mycena sanguinolenta]